MAQMPMRELSDAARRAAEEIDTERVLEVVAHGANCF